MKENWYKYLFFAIAALAIASILLAIFSAHRRKPNIGVPPGRIIGGDRDRHGCIGSAGYSWCASKQKCLRPWEEACPDNDGAVKCGMQNCHGLEIDCGPNPAEVCTDMYALGDKCRQYASCGIKDGKCQQIQNSKFDACKSCVEACQKNNPGDQIKSFECESQCE